MFSIGTHRRLLLLARNSRLALAAGIVCGLLSGLCALAQAYALSATIDGVFLRNQTLAQVWIWMRLLLVAITARGLLVGLQEIASNEVALRVKRNLRERLFERL